jgi:hypothetical protein
MRLTSSPPVANTSPTLSLEYRFSRSSSFDALGLAEIDDSQEPALGTPDPVDA